MTELKFFLLRSPRIMIDDATVTPQTRKAFALLVYLAVTKDPQSRDTLATLLWPRQDQTRARRSLRHALWLVKQAGVGDWLAVDGDRIGLRGAWWSDVSAFQAHIQSNALAEAIPLYRDGFLAGFTLRDCPEFDAWQFLQAEKLRQALAAALQELVQQCDDRGEYETGLDYAQRWRALDPLHEPAQRALMKLYARAGQYAAALHQYEACVRILDEELGIEPEEATQALYQMIRARKWPPSAPTAAQTRGDAPTAIRTEQQSVLHNLPPQPTAFIGRARELDELDRLLATAPPRLITIVAAGGMGKTRLALAAAERQLNTGHFPNGIYFVSLAPVATASSIVPAIAEALDLPVESENRRGKLDERLFDYLRERRLLLILDNCEHLLPEIGVIANLLNTAPNIRILATSRERLRLRGEQLYPIQGLYFPGEEQASDADAPSFSALDLFLHSARRIRPDFAPQPDELPHLVRICRLVEGMPLALELAASWVNMLPAHEIVTEIQNNLDLLATDLRNIPARQRSIRAVFDATWLRLSDGERHTFMQFSVFRGGFTREAAQAVTDASLRLLMALGDKSLLQYDLTQKRYQIHELLRQYAAEKMTQEASRETSARDRHSAYYCAWVNAREAELKDARQEQAMRLFEADIDNVQRAWDWAVQQVKIHSIQEAMDGLGYFYERQGHIQGGQSAFESAAERLTDTASHGSLDTSGQRVLVKLLAWESSFTFLLGDVASAQQLLDRSLDSLAVPALAEADTHPERAFVYARQGLLAVARGHHDALAFYEQSLALYRAAGHHWEVSEVLALMGQWIHTLADVQRAEALYHESLDIKRSLGDHRGVAALLGRLSQVAAERGQFERAEQLAREGNAIYQELQNRYGIVEGLRQLGVIMMWLGRNDEAHRLLTQALALGHDLGDRTLIAQIHSLIGLAASLLGIDAQAHEQAETGLRLARIIGDPNQVAWCLWVMGWALASSEAYADAELVLRESVDLFRQVSTQTNKPRQLGWSLSLLGYVLWRRDDPVSARDVILEVLPISIRLRDFLPIITALPTAALLLAGRGQPVRAAELCALVWRYPLVANSRGWLTTTNDELQAVAASLESKIAEAAGARGQSQDLYETAASVIEALR